MLLTPRFCFTYPLPDYKKSSGTQKLPQISSVFVLWVVDSWILYKGTFENSNLKFGTLWRCFQKSQKVPLGWHNCISKWLFLPSGSLYQQPCLVMSYIKQNCFLTSAQLLYFFSFLPCTMQLSVSPFKNMSFKIIWKSMENICHKNSRGKSHIWPRKLYLKNSILESEKKEKLKQLHKITFSLRLW